MTPHLHNRTNIMWREKLFQLRSKIEVFADAVKSSSKELLVKTQLMSLVDIYLNFIKTCLDSGTYVLEDFLEFTAKAFAIIRKNMADATMAQARAVLPAMLKWKKMLGPEEWSKLYVMIPTVWPVALNSPRLQMFSRIMDQDKVNSHIITSEFPRNFEEARDTVGRVVGDRAVGRFVFGTADTKAKMKVLALSSRTDVVADDFEINMEQVISALPAEDKALVHPSSIGRDGESPSSSRGACPLGHFSRTTNSHEQPTITSIGRTNTGLAISNCRLPSIDGLFELLLTPCGRIASISPAGSLEAVQKRGRAEVMDAEGKMAMPGFVDAHIHLDKCYLLDRCCAARGDFPEALSETLRAKQAFTIEDIVSRARKLIENEISFGTTLMRAHVEVDSVIGMKAIEAILPLKQEYASAVTIQLNVFAQEGITNQPGQVELMRQALKMGADVVGSAPYCDPDPKENIRLTFELAKEFNLPVDFHLDYHLEGKESYLQVVIEETIARGWQDRVCLGHMTHLSTLPMEDLKSVGAQLKEAGISVLALPASDLCMMARADDGNRRRGVCPVHHLHNEGVCAAFASNNVQNLFTFTGDGDVLKIGTLVCQALQLTSEGQARLCLEMASTTAAKALGVSHSLTPGMPADLVILPGTSALDILAAPPVERIVIKKGKVVSKSIFNRQLFL